MSEIGSGDIRNALFDRGRYEELLEGVQRPVRYIGGEWNSVVKDHREVGVTVALAYPDLYEIGMSHLGYRILYSLLNDRPDVAAERVFCPWPDLRAGLESSRMPLASLETDTPLHRFDVIGFSLQYEMTFTNLLTMLHLGGVPLRTADRRSGDPIVIAGGPVVFNAEPIADFIDCIFLGDAEEMIFEFLDRVRELRDGGADRAEMLREFARIPGIYVPSLYRTERDPATGMDVAVPTGDLPFPVKRRLILDIDDHPFPSKIVVPYGEIVHDRISVEIMRGCPVGCRFCQAGYIYRPTREREPGEIKRVVQKSLEATGYDEYSLSSLNTGEFGSIQPLITQMMDEMESEKVALSLGSLHATTLTADLAEQIKRVRKTGFTIAPEGGTQRIRDVINKNLSEEQILDAARHAYSAGWEDMKLYFMIGQPTETEEDIAGIVEISKKIIAEGRRIRNKRVEASLSASSFIPKAYTPFQWCGMDRVESLYRKQEYIRSLVPRAIRFKYHQVETSLMEAVFSRGDRRLGNVLERAWRSGCQFDGWTEHYRHGAWLDAFREEGLDADAYAYREIDPTDRLPWDITDALVNKQWLATDLRRAIKGEAGHTLTICGPEDCHGCAPFAKDCVSGVVAETTGRPMPGADGPGANPAAPGSAASETPAGETTWRYRARYTKEGRLRFLSHLDVMRAVTRSLRRAGVRLAYSQGFHPKPKIAFGPALPVGVSSEAEYLDFESRDALDAEALPRRLTEASPHGLSFVAMRSMQPGELSLSRAIEAARYRVDLPKGIDPADLMARLELAQQNGNVQVERRRKDKIRTVEVDPRQVSIETTGPSSIRLTLPLGDNAVRPEEILGTLLGRDPGRSRVAREAVLATEAALLPGPAPVVPPPAPVTPRAADSPAFSGSPVAPGAPGTPGI